MLTNNISSADRLYFSDSHLRSFEAEVTSCAEDKGRWLITLSRTAFFPEGGGQKGDQGYIGGVFISDTQEKGGEVFHIAASPLPVGDRVTCRLDWPLRFSRMQAHSGEHIVSGLAHSMFGCENVGFHMGEEGVIVDFDRYLEDSDLKAIEKAANEAIWRNAPVRAFFPTEEELSALDYRSKLELTENVRLVEIEGVDLCACCAPHVSSTGEIGLIRITGSIRRRDGVRITMLAGAEAYREAVFRSEIVSGLSRLFSASPEGIIPAAERLISERDGLAYKLKGLRLKEIEEKIENTTPGSPVFIGFSENYLPDENRRLVNGLLPKVKYLAAAFTGTDESGYSYIIASEKIALREKIRGLNERFGGKGGGSDAMVQGSIRAPREAIRAAIEGWIENEDN